jgi:mono/diheme cytochrome c family protein
VNTRASHVALRLGIPIAILCWSLNVLAETPIERGAYLVRGISACGSCHTPRDADEKPIANLELSGRTFELPIAHVAAPNITPDKETGIGSWSDEEVITAIREGKRPDGSLIGPMMPYLFYRRISDTDVKAIVAYLRSVPAVSRKMERTTYSIAVPTSYGPPVGSVPDVTPTDRVTYGAYLAGPLGHCMVCHTPMLQGRLDLTRPGLGGRAYPVAGGGTVPSSNLTPDLDSGIGKWTDKDIKAAITEGVRPDGSHLVPIMLFSSYAQINEGDLDAIIAYLRSLKPMKSQ